jgi:hypothetical protein
MCVVVMHKLLPVLVRDMVFHVLSTHLSLEFSPAFYASRQFFFLEVHRGGGTLRAVREIRSFDGANPSSRNFRTFQENMLLPFLE